MGSVAEKNARDMSFNTSARSSRRYSDITNDTEGEGGDIIDKTEVCASRLVIACIAVALLWSCSLAAVTATLESSGSISRPKTQAVVLEVEKLINDTRRVHDLYQESVQAFLGQCNRTLRRESAEELERARLAQEHNLRARQEAQRAEVMYKHVRGPAA